MAKAKNKKKNVVKKTLKILAWTVGTLVVLLALALWAVVWLISPENLTKYAEQAANKYLDAKVEIGRLELTAYSTFPMLHVDVDSLVVQSGSLDSLMARADSVELPANAEHLLSLTKLHLEINLAEAMIGRFDVKDLSVTDLDVNIVEAAPSITNYAILPLDETEPDSVAQDTAVVELPWIRCKQVLLKGTTRLAYYSAADSISASMRLDTASVVTVGRDAYRLAFAGKADCTMGEEPLLADFPFELNAGLEWNYRRAMDIDVESLQARLLDIPITGNAALLAEEGEPQISKFSLKVDSVRFASVVPRLPVKYQRMFGRVKSNLMASIEVNLEEPYTLTSRKLPSMSGRLIVPDSYWQAKGGRGRIDRLAVDARMELDGNNPNASAVTLSNLVLNGVAVQLQLSGKVTNIFADPYVSATLKGHTDLGVMAGMVNVPLNFTISGEAEANASVDMKMSNLNKENFHKIKLTGDVGLRNLVYDNMLDTMNVKANYASLSFGNRQTYMRRDSTEGDNLLRVTASVDTLYASIPGLNLSLNNMRIGAGAVGMGETQDSTQIVPMGFNVSAGKVRMKQADGTFLATRGVSCKGSVSRFRNMKRMPVFYLGFGIDTMFYRDNSQFVYLKDSKIDLVANRRVNRRRMNRTRQLIDTLRAQHPDWSNDSLLAVVRQTQRRQREELKAKWANRRPQRAKFDDAEVMDMSVDSGFARLLARWQLHGRIRSNTGAMYTPYFPLRNRITDVDVKFNADSLTVENFNYTVGKSSFNLKGKLKNIRSTMMGRTRRPLDIAMILRADSIDVNQLVGAAAKGLTYSNNAVGLSSMDSAITDIEEMQQEMAASQSSADTTLAAFVVPRNIEAKIAVRSNNITFADMNFDKFDGNLFIHDGVINLNNLRATTDIGSAEFNAMYASTDRRNIKFGMDLGLKKINVGEFLHMIPAIDSVMPLLQSVDGIIDAEIATTANLDSVMNIDIPTLRAAVKLHGDSLVFMDAETFKKIAKMLRFKNRERNMIDQMTVELLVENSQMMLFPFMFNVDRYKLGVLGYNDLDLNFRYHISVLKSPIPFKFGINIYGNPDDMHFRFGGAKYKEDDLRAEMVEIVDTTRINLREQINSALRRGANAALRSNLNVGGRRPDMRRMVDAAEDDNLTAADSLQMMNEGLIERPDTISSVPAVNEGRQDSAGEEDRENGNAGSEQQGGGDTAMLHRPAALKPDALEPAAGNAA